MRTNIDVKTENTKLQQFCHLGRKKFCCSAEIEIKIALGKKKNFKGKEECFNKFTRKTF